MMEFLKVTVLSVLQGVAEFLPISSSGHLAIGQELVGLETPDLRLEIFLHVGTLTSILIFYFATVWRIVRRFEWIYVCKILVSALPAVAVYALFHDAIESLFDNTRMVGALLMFTGAVLVGTRYLPRGGRDISFARALLMGVGQAVALLPGVSRSGLTLASARAGRVDPAKSAEFSFLMSAPLILGALLLQTLKMTGVSDGAASAADDGLGWGLLVYGAALSAVVGYGALAFLVRALKGKWFWLFGPYCLTAGLLTLVFARGA